MKITAVFLSKKKHNDSKWLVDKIKAQNKRNENKVTINNFNGFDKKNIKLGLNTSKLFMLVILIFGIYLLAKHISFLSKVIYFGSNFRQAEGNNVELADVFNAYGIYNKENYLFNEIKFIDEAKKSENKDDEIEILDSLVKDKNEQSVFGKNKDINVEITENSENIQRINLNKMKILNYSSKRDIDFKSLAASNITLTKKSDKILLYNTHTSESYANSDKYKFEYSGARRSQDATYNMLSVAKKFKENLDSKGFEVVHDTTPHDYGTYTSSYARSRITVKNAIAAMGHAGISIDVHRDATNDLDYRPVVKINGIEVAQCMLVMGVGTDVTNNPYYEDNLRLAFKIQQLADEVYPGLFKPMIIRNSIYNQDLNKYSLLIEVGASGNTLDEAYLATRCLSNLLNIIYKD